MKKHVVLIALVGLIGSFGLPAVASAAPYNLATLISNIGFESGLTGWTYTGTAVNPDTYLTDAEWAAQSWSNSSSVLSDLALAALYPGQPWGLTPDITHVQQTGGAVDPGGVIGAAVGTGFVGSREDGDPAAFDDRNFQLSYFLNAGFLSGDTFSLTTWGNRGRLNDDFGVANGSSTLTFRLVGDAVGPDYNGPLCTFTSWGVDGAWASQNCSWTLDRNVTNLTLRVTGQNSNHDRYVAVDMGPAGTPGTTSAVPEPGTLAMLGIGLTLAAMKLRARKQ